MTNKQKFIVDSNILYPIILKQAGTLEKAFLELIMNSIDAGATKIIIIFNGNDFIIEDNGKGFESEENIENFFKTFGKPHEEGDATYGKFRMGRGQIMAFTKNTWYSNNFKMEVDIKEFLGYDFFITDEFIDGCKITGTLYEPLESASLIKFTQELKSLIRFSQIPVYFNDELISDEINKISWDIETDFAYIKFDNKRNLEVYNLGVKVRDYSSWSIGTGGIIVSKQQLDVNFARNDILTTKCKVWKKIDKVIEKKLNERIKKSIKKDADLTQDEISVYSKKLITGELSYWDARNVKIFADIKGKKYTLIQILKENIIAISSDESLIGDKVYEKKLAFVLDIIILENFGFKTLSTLFNSLIQYISNSHKTINNDPNSTDREKLMVLKDLNLAEISTRTVIDDISYFNNTINSMHTIIDNSELNIKEQLCLKVLNELENDIRYLINENCTPARKKRDIVAGVSELSYGWTDGKTYIAIDREVLKKARMGSIGFTYLCTLIIHEYLHTTYDNKTHTHNEVFYHIYHNTILTNKRYWGRTEGSLGDIVFRMTKRFFNLYSQNSIKIPLSYLAIPTTIYKEISNKELKNVDESEMYFENFEEYIPEETDTQLLY